MLGGENYAASDLGLWKSREYSGKVDEELRGGVRYYCQVGVVSLCDLLRKIEVYTLLMIILVHSA